MSAGQVMSMVQVVITLLAVIIVSVVWTNRRSRDLIHRWAEMNGYELISMEHRWFHLGPYWWRTTRGQTVFRVQVRDTTGRLLSGWVRCGTWLAGLFSDAVDVKWDEPGVSSSRGAFPVVMTDQERNKQADEQDF